MSEKTPSEIGRSAHLAEVRKQFKYRTDWQPINSELKKIEKMASMGLYDAQMAAILGINPTEFSQLKMSYEDVRLAITRGRANKILKLSTSMMKRAMKNDTVGGIFFMKTMGGFDDTGNPYPENCEDGIPIKIDPDMPYSKAVQVYVNKLVVKK